MTAEVDIEGKYDYFFNSKEWEERNADKFTCLKSIPIYEDEEFVALCKSNAEILEQVTNRATDCLLDRVWRIENKRLKVQFDNFITINPDPHITWAFHSSSADNLFAISQEGFKLPQNNSRQDGWGYLFLGQMIYFAPKLKNGIFYSRDTLGYIIIAQIKLGKSMIAETQLQFMTPETLFKKGYDSMVSYQASSKGTIFAIPAAHQILPRFLLQYRKLPKTQLLNMSREVRLLHQSTFVCPNVEFVNMSKLGGPYINHGKIHEDCSFVTVWDGFPKFGVHCLIIPKRDAIREHLGHQDVAMLLDMHAYSKWLVEEFRRRSSVQLAVGIPCNPAQVQLHAHVFSPHQPRPSLQKSQAKKYAFPAMRTIKDVIWYVVRKDAKIINAEAYAAIRKLLLSDNDTVDIAQAMQNSDLFTVAKPQLNSSTEQPSNESTTSFQETFVQSAVPNILVCTLCNLKVHINSLGTHTASQRHRHNVILYPSGRPKNEVQTYMPVGPPSFSSSFSTSPFPYSSSRKHHFW